MEGVKVLKQRKTRYSINTIIAIILFIGIIALINFVSDRHHLRIDLTQTGMFSLADQSAKILKDLDSEVMVYAFFQSPDRRLRDLLDEFKIKSDKFNFKFVDPDREPEIAKAYEVKQYGIVVVKSGENMEQIIDVNEEKLTNAVLKVSRKEQKRVYFLVGHGEREIENIEREGYNGAKQALENENYDIGTMMLAREGSIPEDCAALIIASPKIALLENEIELIERYLKDGGSLLLMLDPAQGAGLEGFLADWDVEVGDDIVVDISGMGRLFGAGPTIPLVSDYPSHKITDEFNLMTFFPLTRSVKPATQGGVGLEIQTIVQTTARSWAEKNYEEEPFRLDEEMDLKGPISLAIALKKEFAAESDTLEGEGLIKSEKNSARMVVFGDADFACNSYFSVSGNKDLFLNVVNWLAEEEDLISIRPRQLEDRRVSMTAAQSRNVFYLTVIALPLILLAVGITVKVKRR
jgi:ABC-type uncharacterized transport system involved in gliding motility auxiliary subunit